MNNVLVVNSSVNTSGTPDYVHTMGIWETFTYSIFYDEGLLSMIGFHPAAWRNWTMLESALLYRLDLWSERKKKKKEEISASADGGPRSPSAHA